MSKYKHTSKKVLGFLSTKLSTQKHSCIGTFQSSNRVLELG